MDDDSFVHCTIHRTTNEHREKQLKVYLVYVEVGYFSPPNDLGVEFYHKPNLLDDAVPFRGPHLQFQIESLA